MRVVESFGPVTIRYGLDGRICPRLGQHAPSERGRSGAICARGGAAVDFRVLGVSLRQIACVIFADLPFDGLYLYGDDRPLLSPGIARRLALTSRCPAGPRGA